MKGFYYKNKILNFYITALLRTKLVSWLKYALRKHRDTILPVTAKMQDLALLLTKKTPNIRQNGRSSNKKRTLSMAVRDLGCLHALHVLQPGDYLLV
jgi:PHP family Zn ribbon phosphoesterase